MSYVYNFHNQSYMVPKCCICCCSTDSLQNVSITMCEVQPLYFDRKIQYQKTMTFQFCRRCRQLRRRQDLSVLLFFASIATYFLLQFLTLRFQYDVISFPYNLLVPLGITILIFLPLYFKRSRIERLGLTEDEIKLLEVAKKPVTFNAASSSTTWFNFANSEYEFLFFLLNSDSLAEQYSDGFSY